MRPYFLVLGGLAVAITLSAQGKGKGHGKGNAPSEATQTTVVSVVFTDSERLVIQRWVREMPAAGLPPGLAKRDELPPGLRKHLQKNGTLPPGLQKKISPFPDDLSRRLSALPAACGCQRVFLDRKALIIARATSAILDVISLF